MAWKGPADEGAVYEAARVVAAQLCCTEDDAIRRPVDYSAAVSRTVADTARLVRDGVVRFDQ